MRHLTRFACCFLAVSMVSGCLGNVPLIQRAGFVGATPAETERPVSEGLGAEISDQAEAPAETVTPENLPDAQIPAPLAPEPEEARIGLFAKVLNRRAGPVAKEADPFALDGAVSVAKAEALTADDLPEPTRVSLQRGGLFGALTRRAPGEGQQELKPGSALRYGALATVCGLSNRALGTRVASYPDTSGRYALYDTNPNGIEPRTHYLTGFKDGCARRFTAALAVFGGPSGHEATRYAASHDHLPMTRTDREYENLRARACGRPVGRGCPDRAFTKFESMTVFVSIYERFETNPRWADLLIHNGVVVAKDFKGGT